MNLILLVPAYNPPLRLVKLIKELSASPVSAVVVVNDGSDSESKAIFQAIRGLRKVVLLEHAVNLGKGAALKTGFNYIYCHFRSKVGVVTFDADGQHVKKDILEIGHALLQNPQTLILGARSFDAATPFRSLAGNKITKGIYRMLIGQKVSDTQSGLRGVPMDFLPLLLKISSNGYEFELDMLIACKHSGRVILEKRIQTIYLDQNESSHFSLLLDSMKIYFVLMRFTLSSLITAAIDYTVFLLIYSHQGDLLLSQIAARMVALTFNYLLVKKFVFYSEQKNIYTFPKYLLLVAVAGAISYYLIQALSDYANLNVVTAKIAVESLIFLANFTIQRDFIFTRAQAKTRTDWDRYYSQPSSLAVISRTITSAMLAGMIRKYLPGDSRQARIGELGGANSCFYQDLQRRFAFKEYHVFDNNQLGLDKLQTRSGNSGNLRVHHADILKIDQKLKMDLTFSVGLIEHFEPADTQKAIAAHFKLLPPGGVAVISFPTPTWLYKLTRYFSELLGLWIFHDERPLTASEVEGTLRKLGHIEHVQINWFIFLTQMFIVARKGSPSSKR
jgi:glycosyltransferase involved in cell wall biosynthesis